MKSFKEHQGNKVTLSQFMSVEDTVTDGNCGAQAVKQLLLNGIGNFPNMQGTMIGDQTDLSTVRADICLVAKEYMHLKIFLEDMHKEVKQDNQNTIDNYDYSNIFTSYQKIFNNNIDFFKKALEEEMKHRANDLSVEEGMRIRCNYIKTDILPDLESFEEVSILAPIFQNDIINICQNLAFDVWDTLRLHNIPCNHQITQEIIKTYVDKVSISNEWFTSYELVAYLHHHGFMQNKYKPTDEGTFICYIHHEMANEIWLYNNKNSTKHDIGNLGTHWVALEHLSTVDYPVSDENEMIIAPDVEDFTWVHQAAEEAAMRQAQDKLLSQANIQPAEKPKKKMVTFNQEAEVKQYLLADEERKEKLEAQYSAEKYDKLSDSVKKGRIEYYKNYEHLKKPKSLFNEVDHGFKKINTGFLEDQEQIPALTMHKMLKPCLGPSRVRAENKIEERLPIVVTKETKQPARFEQYSEIREDEIYDAPQEQVISSMPIVVTKETKQPAQIKQHIDIPRDEIYDASQEQVISSMPIVVTKEIKHTAQIKQHIDIPRDEKYDASQEQVISSMPIVVKKAIKQPAQIEQYIEVQQDEIHDSSHGQMVSVQLKKVLQEQKISQEKNNLKNYAKAKLKADMAIFYKDYQEEFIADEESVCYAKQKIIKACEKGDIDQIKKIVAKYKGNIINYKSYGTEAIDSGNPILHAVVRNYYNYKEENEINEAHEIIQYLLNAGADIQLQNTDGKTALHLAVEVIANEKMIRLLIAYGAKLDITDDEGNTPLALAAINDDCSLVECLLELDPNKTAQKVCQVMDSALEKGSTKAIYLLEDYLLECYGTYDQIIELALTQDCLGVVRYILAEGFASVEEEDKAFDILRLAVKKNDPDIVAAMLPNCKHMIDDDKKGEGSTLLYHATLMSYTAIAKMLIENGADIDAKAKYLGDDTPWSNIVNDNMIELMPTIFEQLRKAGKNVADYINAQLSNGKLPLNIAISYDKADMIKLLLANGASPLAKDKAGKMPLLVAIERHSSIISIIFDQLRESGKNIADYINTKLENGTTLLNSAIRHHRPDTAELLISNGADVEAADEDGETPLFNALYSRHLELMLVILEQLEKSGKNIADYVNTKLEDGTTLLHIAAAHNLAQAAEILIERGADTAAKNNNGATPLTTAILKHNSKAALLILEKSETNITSYINDPINANGSTMLDYVMHYSALIDPEIAKKLIEMGADYSSDKKLLNYIWFSIIFGKKVDLMQVIFNQLKTSEKSIADHINQDIDGQGNTVLHRLIQEDRYYGSYDIAKELITNGANPLAKNNKGETPWSMIIEGNYGSLIPIICEQELGKNLLNEVIDEHGHTALDIAVLNGKVDVAKKLTEMLTDEEDKNNAEKKLVEMAADVEAKNNAEKIRIFRAEGKHVDGIFARLMSFKKQKDIANHINDKTDDGGCTILHLAIRHKKHEMAKKLIEMGADLLAKDDVGETPLFAAIVYDANQNDFNQHHTKLMYFIFKQLKLSGQNVYEYTNTDIDGHGNTALHIAIQHEELTTANKLQKNPAHLRAKNDAGETPLFSAIKSDIGRVRAILEQFNDLRKSINIIKNSLQIASDSERGGALTELTKLEQSIKDYINNDIDGKGNTALHFAVRNEENNYLVQELLMYDADLLAKDVLGETPLSAVIEQGSLWFLQCIFAQLETLGKNIADYINVGIDGQGNTALHIAVSNAKTEIAEWLIQRGACLTAINSSDETPLSRAEKYNQTAIYDLILKKLEELEKIHKVDQYRDTDLHIAIHNQDINSTKELIEKNADLMAKNKLGETALYMAITECPFEFVQNILVQLKILEKNVADYLNVDIDGKGNTALHLAIYQKDLDLAEEFIKYGADLGAINSSEETPLSLARKNNQIAIKNLILKQLGEAEGGYIDNHPEDYRNKELLIAIRNKKTDIAKELIKNGADLKMRDPQGKTPLVLAIGCKQDDVKDLILEQLRKNGENAANYFHNDNGDQILHIAIRNQETDTAKELMKAGANILAKDSLGKTPLTLAIECGQLEIIPIIFKQLWTLRKQIQSVLDWRELAQEENRLPLSTELEKIVQNLVDYVNQDIDGQGNTALHFAISNKEIETVKELLISNADIMAKNKLGQTPVSLVINYRSGSMKDIYKQLIKKWQKSTSDISQDIDGQGNTMLHFAVSKKNLSLAKWLIQNNACLTAINIYEETPLSVAVKCKRTEIIMIIVEQLYKSAAANVQYHINTEIDSNKNTMLHFAIEAKKLELAKWLIQKGASIYAVNSFGKTPLSVAIEIELDIVDIDNLFLRGASLLERFYCYAKRYIKEQKQLNKLSDLLDSEIKALSSEEKAEILPIMKQAKEKIREQENTTKIKIDIINFSKDTQNKKKEKIAPLEALKEECIKVIMIDQNEAICRINNKLESVTKNLTKKSQEICETKKQLVYSSKALDTGEELSYSIRHNDLDVVKYLCNNNNISHFIVDDTQGKLSALDAAFSCGQIDIAKYLIDYLLADRQWIKVEENQRIVLGSIKENLYVIGSGELLEHFLTKLQVAETRESEQTINESTELTSVGSMSDAGSEASQNILVGENFNTDYFNMNDYA